MKKVLYSLLVLCGVMGLWSCDETSEDTSKITYFVNFELKGDASVQIPVGSDYTDPGVIAMEGENDITSSVEISNSVNTNEAGMYEIKYSAKNVDGYSKSISREVIVYDPNIKDISGTYTIDSSVSYRDYTGVGKSNFKGDYKVTITQFLPGIFYISDFLGGWYDQGAAYGSDYAMTGYFTVKKDNTLELQSSFIKGWGDSLDGITGGKLDPVTGQITWTVAYGGTMKFYEVLNK